MQRRPLAALGVLMIATCMVLGFSTDTRSSSEVIYIMNGKVGLGMSLDEGDDDWDPVDRIARADTFFCFAASGPGAYGQAGTDERGYTFDGPSGGSATAGWTGVDETEQPGAWWNLENAQMNAGYGTDPILTVPQFDGMPNNFALWCGRDEVWGWENPMGYGNSWDQYWVADLGGGGAPTSVTYDFYYIGDFEGGVFDYFQFMTEDAGGELVEIFSNRVLGEQTLQHYTGNYPNARDRLVWRFVSSAYGSDQDGGYVSGIGAVWIDKIVISTPAGFADYSTDFETGTVPAGMSATVAPGAGFYGDLHEDLYSEDPCIENSSFAWAFFDPEAPPEPPYPLPPVPYGPPYIRNSIESPLLERKYVAGNPVGEVLELRPEDAVYLDYWIYMDNPLEGLVYHYWSAAALTAEGPGLGRFAGDNAHYYTNAKQWLQRRENISLALAESAGGGTVTGIKVRLGVVDMAEIWDGVYGGGEPHTPAPYLDNARVMIINTSSIGWDVSGQWRWQDNFPEVGNNKVRIDGALHVEPDASQTLVIADSMAIRLNADLAGGIKVVPPGPQNPSGVNRPAVYCYWRVVAGPHAGSTSASMGDPDAADGIWSPKIAGTEIIYGNVWNTMIAAPAAIQGRIVPDRWAFDLNDAYFEGGDVIQYFLQMETTGGLKETRPLHAKSDPVDYPYLPSWYVMRCLPTAGAELLICDDGPGDMPEWEEAFRMSGYTDYDVYTTKAPGSFLHNGLGGRAVLADIDQYGLIVWDSGDVEAQTLANSSVDDRDKSDDAGLLDDWVTNAGHQAYLWVMGNEIAGDLMNTEPFLGGDLGAFLLSSNVYYDDATGIHRPKVYTALGCLDPGHFWLDGGCPTVENFSLVRTNGTFTVPGFVWAVVPSGYPSAVAGTFNSDPDGNGNTELPFRTRALFTPWSYRYAQEATDSDLPGVDYVRAMVGNVLEDCFNHLPDAPPDALPEIPAVTRLDGSFPNPFNPKTTIRFSLSCAEAVNLSVYDLSGRLVSVLIDGPMPAGHHEVAWNGKDADGVKAASGIYFCKMNAGAYSEELKMLLLK